MVERAILGADPSEFAAHLTLSGLLKELHDARNLVLGRIAKLYAIADELEQHPFLAMGAKGEDLLVDRGRPLEGIWATAPYLHNGSVPNLAELLLPPAQRSPVFHIGSREFDPDKVGFRTDKGFRFDTTLPGNSNGGHDYGAQGLKTDADRAALLEYLKSL